METEISYFDFGPKEVERQEENSFINSLVKNSLLCHWILTYSTFDSWFHDNFMYHSSITNKIWHIIHEQYNNVLKLPGQKHKQYEWFGSG